MCYVDRLVPRGGKRSSSGIRTVEGLDKVGFAFSLKTPGDLTLAWLGGGVKMVMSTGSRGGACRSSSSAVQTEAAGVP